MIYNYKKQEDKYFFAGLLNTAMDNFDLSLHELNRRINSKQNDSLSVIDYAFDKKRPLFELDRNFEILKESLTFLSVLPEYHREQNKDNEEGFFQFVQSFLKELYKLTNSIRNYYTHYHHNEIEIDNSILDFLNTIMLKSVLKTKNGRTKNESVKESLWKNFQSEFITIVKQKDVKNKVKAHQRREFVLNRMFDPFLYKNNENEQVELKHNVECNEGNQLSKSGFVLFLSIFLDKKQITLLFDNFDYSVNDEEWELQKNIIRWIYTTHSYKSIRYLFKSNYDRDSLLLQMASELNKAPRELYNYLSKTDKQEFVEDINAYLKDNADSYTDQTLVAHEVVRRRYEDKFTYFALRFLDELISFPNLRFQVVVGKFNHNTMTKTYQSTTLSTERSILEKVSVFERLSEVTKKKKEYFENSEKKEIKDWTEFPNPKYQFYGNSIGIWLEDKLLGKPNAPTTRENDKLSKYDVLEKIGLKDQYKRPVGYLSVYELPALLHALLIDKKSPFEIEKSIRNQINKQRRTLSKIETEENLNNKLKRKRRKLQSEESVHWEKIKDELDKESVFNPLDEIRKNYKRPPKFENGLTNSEKGKISTWLCKDIKRFTKVETRKEWKGYQFAEFQSIMSYFDMDKYRVENFMKIDLSIKEQQSFLFKGFNYHLNTLYEFYLYYLSKRKNYLERLLKKVVQRKNCQNDLFTILPENRFSNKKSVKDFFSDKMQSPFMLARGIFDQKPSVYNRNKGTVDLADWYIVSSHRDKAQNYYSYTRHYPISFDEKGKVENTISISPDKGLKEQYTYFAKKRNGGYEKTQIEKSFQKSIYKNETALRRIMRNDFYILQMIKHFYQNKSEIDKLELEKITLKDFYLTKSEKIEREKTTKEDFVFDESYILKKQIKITFFNGRIEGYAKLKEAGKYKRLLLDEKVATFVSYFDNTKVWSIEMIMNQLNDYEQIRSKVFFSKVHELEKKILVDAESKGEGERLLQQNNPNFKKYLMYKYLNNGETYAQFDKIEMSKSSINEIPDSFKNLFVLVLIRNKFAHNQLLPKNVFDYVNDKIPMQENERIGSYFQRVFESFIERQKVL